MRYLLSFLLFLALVAAALFVPASRAGAAGVAPPTITPEGTFAEDILARHRKGWRLAEYEIRYDGEREEVVSVSIILQRGPDAERFTLGFDDWGSRAIEYTREPTAAPAEHRVYAAEGALFDALATKGPVRVGSGCVDYYLEIGGEPVGISSRDYYVVTASATGQEARRKLATTLSSAIGAGMDLTAVRTVDDGDGRFVEIALADGTGLTLRAQLDEGGEVVGMEARTAPASYAWERLRNAGRLGRALRRTGAEIRAISFDDETRHLTIMLDGRRRIRIDTSDVEPTEHANEDGDCGC